MNMPRSATPARPPHSATAVLGHRLLPIGGHRLSRQILISRLNHARHARLASNRDGQQDRLRSTRRWFIHYKRRKLSCLATCFGSFRPRLVLERGSTGCFENQLCKASALRKDPSSTTVIAPRFYFRKTQIGMKLRKHDNTKGLASSNLPCICVLGSEDGSKAWRGRPKIPGSYEAARERCRRAVEAGIEPEQSLERRKASSDRARLGGAGKRGRRQAMGLFAGIDVVKDTLAVALSSGQEWSCPNDARGITLLVERLEAESPALVVLEATGGYEGELLAALIAAGIETRRVNPREVHHFARAAGQLAKTDRIDARMLALFAERIRPPARALPDPEREQLKALVGRRTQLLQMITAERNRRAQAQRCLARSLERTIRALELELKLIDREIAERLSRSTTLKPLRDLITSLPGAGPVLGATLIARVPELGRLSRRQIAALIRVAPFTRQSGQWRGRDMIFGGRAPVRATLYIAAISAVRYNPPLRAFYRRLRERGKPAKLALTAVMRKLLTILNAMLKHHTVWSAPCPA